MAPNEVNLKSERQGWVVGKYDSKENPKSDVDLDLGYVKRNT